MLASSSFPWDFSAVFAHFIRFSRALPCSFNIKTKWRACRLSEKATADEEKLQLTSTGQQWVRVGVGRWVLRVGCWNPGWGWTWQLVRPLRQSIDTSEAAGWGAGQSNSGSQKDKNSRAKKEANVWWSVKMNVIIKQIWEAARDPEYRATIVAGHKGDFCRLLTTASWDGTFVSIYSRCLTVVNKESKY